MRNLIYIICFIFPPLINAQTAEKEFADNGFKTVFSFEKGFFDGEYKTYYPNGIVKAEGRFEKNNRVGKWTVYDPTGRMIQQRDYSNSLSYIRIFPEKSATGPASLFDTTFYSLKHNTSGFIDYAPLRERMVKYEKRIWRYLSKEDNKAVFKNNFLFKQLYAHATDPDTSKLSYCSSDEKFAKKLSKEELKKFSLDNYSVIGFKIKEDMFYENERCISETRIIGICPVGINKEKDTVDMFWMYYPHTRETLAKVKMKGKDFFKDVKTLEDVFFFRNFSAEIIKEANIYDKNLTDYCKSEEEMEQERIRIEITILEMEHDIWLGNLPSLY